jgi:peptide/nickel transport system substrate-binding protein
MIRSKTRAARRRVITKWLVMIAATSLVAVACGGDDDATTDGDGPATSDEAVTASGPATTDGQDDGGEPPSTSATGSDAAAPATTSGEQEPGEGEPVAGGEATYLFQSELGTNFDPTKLISVSASIATGNVGYLLYGMLVATDPSTLEVEPHMLESLEGSADGTVWTLRLRPGLTFSDGTPFDAEAIKLNWARHADPANASGARGVVAGMQAIEVIDPVTLEVTLSEPNQQFPRTLAQYSITFIAAPSAIEAGTVAEHPIGAGPFLLEEWARDDHMTFVKNPTYWDAPRPYLDTLTIRPIIDPTQRINSMLSGQGDVAFAYAGQIQPAVDEGLDVHPISMNGGTAVLFNFGTPLGSDVRFRRAVRLAVDNAQVAEVVDRGAGADDATTFFTADSPFYDAEFATPAPDLAAAQALIDEMVAENGGPIEFAISTGPPQQPIADLLQAQLSQLDGVNVTVEVLAVGPYIEAVVVQKNFTVAMWNTFNLDPEPRSHDFFLTGSPRNYTNGYSNPAVDEALKAGRTATDPEDRKAAYETLQRLLLEDVPVLTVKRSDHYIVSNPETIHGLSFVEDGIARWEHVWVD